MSASQRIYLDNAATSFPKPEAVYVAVEHYQRHLGAAEGRSATRKATEVHVVLDRCRLRAARLLGAETADRIVFTFNATDSLNLALKGLLKPGDHVVTSAIEHNSVLRPLRALQEGGVEVTRVAPDADGFVRVGDVRQALRKSTRLVALIHASNVTGAIQPLEQVGEVAHAAGALFLVDAAQSAGHLPVNVSRLPIDLLACAGHKGLLGPLGTGLLYLRPGVEEQLESLRQGGTGTNSEDDQQPARLPEKYESGNPNVLGLYGLEAALAWLEERGVPQVRQHEIDLTARLLEGLRSIPRLRVYGPQAVEKRVGVVSLTIDGLEPQEVAAVLDESFGIETRAGLHCAPGVHRALGTLMGGGTLRLSPGVFTTEAHIDQAVRALREIAAV
jgi:cysteine desulfurase family protein